MKLSDDGSVIHKPLTLPTVLPLKLCVTLVEDVCDNIVHKIRKPRLAATSTTDTKNHYRRASYSLKEVAKEI